MNIYEAIEKVDLHKLKIALKKGANLNVKLDGQTPLHKAIEMNNTEIVKEILAAGANVKAVDNEESTPLHRATEKNNPEIVNAIIAAGANVNAENNEESTPLHKATEKNNPEIVKAIIAAGLI